MLSSPVSPGPGLAGRTAVAALVLAGEKFLLGLLLDSATGSHGAGFGRWLWDTQHYALRFLVPFAAIAALLACVQDNPRLRAANVRVRAVGLRLKLLLLHVLLLAPLGLLTWSFYGHHGLAIPLPLTAVLWFAVAVAAVLALLAALAPWNIWRAAIAALGTAWAYAAAAGAVAVLAMDWSQMLWAPTAGVTFQLVAQVLHPLLPQLRIDAATRILDTGRFAVQVTDYCSGLEGAGLMLAFWGAWLVYFRKEYRFPQALIIAPASLCLLFMLNVLRIAVLVLIGHAGYPDTAAHGFHSQAGWIAFNATACGIVYASRKSPWLVRHGENPVQPRATNPTLIYLLPFLAILAAGMLSHALSAGFETLYALRLLAACIALWYCRTGLRDLDWRFGWHGLAAGVLVCAVWLAAARYLLNPAGMPDPLAAMSPAGRLLWITTRALAGVATVPIAEELAYRGFLMRRIQSEDFDALPFKQVRRTGLAVSAVVFGISHGAMWLPGIFAGLAYGWVAMRTGRIGDCIAAHAVTNGLLALCVLLQQQWQLW